MSCRFAQIAMAPRTPRAALPDPSVASAATALLIDFEQYQPVIATIALASVPPSTDIGHPGVRARVRRKPAPRKQPPAAKPSSASVDPEALHALLDCLVDLAIRQLRDEGECDETERTGAEE